MTFGNGEMKKFLFVAPEAVRTTASLGRWIDLALAHNATLPAKKVGAKVAPAQPKKALPKSASTGRSAKQR